MLIKLLIILFISISAIYPQELFSAQGYVKLLYSNSRIKSYHDEQTDILSLNDFTFHARGNFRVYPSENITFGSELRFRMINGESLEKISGYKESLIPNYGMIRIDKKIYDNKNNFAYFEIDRLWGDYQTGNFQATIGKQRIAWGTSWVWNITDLFNPLSYLDFDYEERPGTDALRLQYYTGAVTKIDFAFAPSKKFYYSTSAIQLSYNAFNYDFFFLTGIKNKKMIYGFSWVGDIYSAGFRGEALLAGKPIYKNEFAVYQITEKELDKILFSSVISLDYTFPNSFYLHFEALYNNLGRRNNTQLFVNVSNHLGLLSPARLTLFQEIAYNLSPLSRGGVFILFNPYNSGYVLVPLYQLSLIENLDLYITAFFGGKKNTEYELFNRMIFVRLKQSF